MQTSKHSTSKNPSGLKRLPKALKHSISGLVVAWKYEAGFRQYTVVSLLLTPFSFVLSQSIQHWVVLIASLVFLLYSEIVNSAVEAVADATKPEYDPIIGRAKDLGSASVFVALLLAILVWSMAVYQYFYPL